MPFDAASDASDEVLIVAFGNGDREAARLLTARLAPKIMGIAYRMLGDRAEAEDVMQEALMRLWRFAPKWRQGEAKVTTWLYRVVSNLCMDRLRKKRSLAMDDIDEPADDVPGVADQMVTRERMNALDAALLELPRRQRQAVILRHLEGAANPEIAQIMDISVEAVESLTARGKRSLSKILGARRKELGYGDE